MHDAMLETADFSSLDQMLNHIHSNVFWGVRSNYRSIPTDCPQRDERQGWLGDRYVVSRSESYLFNVAAFYRNNTQTANILPLAFGMAAPENKQRVFDSLIQDIQMKSNGHVGTGLVGVQWLMRTLSENDRADVALEIATQPTYPGWGYMVTKGATTVWELWNGDTADPAMNSGTHVMQIGGLGLWMYEDLAGIRPDPENPGFKHILIHRYPVKELSFVKASHQSPYGSIASH